MKLPAMKLTNHLHLVLGLRLHGAVPPLPIYLSGTDRNSSTLAKRHKCSDLDRAMNYKPSYVEIKCQLDATEVFIADLISCLTCFGHHYAHHQELKSIISGYCLWYFML